MALCVHVWVDGLEGEMKDLRSIALTATLITGVACYIAAIYSITQQQWREVLIFAALGCIAANQVTIRTEIAGIIGR
jgi:hypothetical protein